MVCSLPLVLNQESVNVRNKSDHCLNAPHHADSMPASMLPLQHRLASLLSNLTVMCPDLHQKTILYQRHI